MGFQKFLNIRHYQSRTLSIMFCVAHIEKAREQGLNPGEKSKNARGVAVITQKDLAKQLDVYQNHSVRCYGIISSIPFAV